MFQINELQLEKCRLLLYYVLQYFYNYMFRPFSLGHLQVVYTRP